MPAGRPREFDVDRAVDTAMEVFWAKGYEGTSMGDLTTALGVWRGSLYSAFESKKGLFDRALQRYCETVGNYVAHAVQADDVRDVVRGVWYGAVRATTGAYTPAGCLIVQGALNPATDGGEVWERLAGIRRDDHTRLQARFAAEPGPLPGGLPPAVLASLVVTVQHGIAVQARTGVTREALLDTVDAALAGLGVPAGRDAQYA